MSKRDILESLGEIDGYKLHTVHYLFGAVYKSITKDGDLRRNIIYEYESEEICDSIESTLAEIKERHEYTGDAFDYMIHDGYIFYVMKEEYSYFEENDGDEDIFDLSFEIATGDNIKKFLKHVIVMDIIESAINTGNISKLLEIDGIDKDVVTQYGVASELIGLDKYTKSTIVSSVDDTTIEISYAIPDKSCVDKFLCELSKIVRKYKHVNIR
ncbi:MAG: hypothetical protein ACRDD8_11295 [Bacteroidales bacterium]